MAGFVRLFYDLWYELFSVNAVEMQPEEDSLLETLCQIFEGVVLDAKHFRTHCWLPRMRKMLNDKTIEASEQLTDFVVKEFTNKYGFLLLISVL